MVNSSATAPLLFQVRNRQVLNNIEDDWRSNGLHPLTPEGGFPANMAHEVTRVSDDELRVVNTEGEVSVFRVTAATNQRGKAQGNGGRS